MPTDDIEHDPFTDHAAIDERSLVAESTLSVGRNATLTLGTDSLIVLDEGLRKAATLDCCGVLPERSANTRAIPYFNVLWAEVGKLDLTIQYANPSKSTVGVAYIHYNFDGPIDGVTKWTGRLMDRAYGEAKRRKRVKLLINPFGGTGKAAKVYAAQIEPVLAAARCEVDVEKTQYSGHAKEIAEKLDIETCDVLACASGDGLPYECFNGLAENKPDALNRVAVVQLPCGSGNAMCWNCLGTGDPAVAALGIVKGLPSPLDLASVTQGDRRSLSFLSQAIGIVAESDLGTDNVRWMGDARFTYGFLVRLLGKTIYPCEIAFKEEISDKRKIKEHFVREVKKGVELERLPGLPDLRYGSINDPIPDDWTKLSYPNLGNLYCGNMSYMARDAPFFPASLPCDGLMDLVTIDGDIPRHKSLNLLISVPKNTFFDHQLVSVRKISALRVIPKYGRFAESSGKKGAEGYFSVDGEKFPFEPFQIEIHKGLGTVLARRRGLYESPGPLGWQDIHLEEA